MARTVLSVNSVRFDPDADPDPELVMKVNNPGVWVADITITLRHDLFGSKWIGKPLPEVEWAFESLVSPPLNGYVIEPTPGREREAINVIFLDAVPGTAMGVLVVRRIHSISL